MKKIIGVLIVIGIYVAMAFYAGYEGEQKAREKFALAETQSAEQGLELRLNSYERGVFYSDVDITATTKNMILPSGAIAFSSKTRVQHGPVLVKGGLGIGLFASTSTVNVHTGVAEVDQSIKEIFGDSIGEVVTRAGFDNHYVATWTIPSVNRKEDDKEFSLAGAHLTAEGTFNDTDVAGEFAIGPITAKSSGGNLLAISPVSGHYQVDDVEDNLHLMNLDAALDTIKVQDPDSMVELTIEKLTSTQRQVLVNDKIDTQINFKIGSIKGPIEVSDVYYDVQLNQLDKHFAQEWSKFSRNLQSADPAVLDEHADEKLNELMLLALKEDLALTINAGANYAGGTATLKLDAKYVPLPDNKNLVDIVNPADYFLLVDGDLVLEVSESIVAQSPLILMISPYLDSYITQADGKYIVKASMKKGKIIVGKTELPAEMLWTMLMLGAGAQDTVDDSNDGAIGVDMHDMPTDDPDAI